VVDDREVVVAEEAPSPLQAQSYPFEPKAGMYPGSRLTSPVPWITSSALGSAASASSSARPTTYARIPTAMPSAINKSSNTIRDLRPWRDVTFPSLSRPHNELAGPADVLADRGRQLLGRVEPLLVA